MHNRKAVLAFSMVCLLFCVLLVSCYRPGTLGAMGYYDAYELGKNAVPVFTKVPSGDASKFDKVKLLDTDSYGRVLYSYWSDGNGTFLMICQQSKKISNYNFKLYWYDECWLAKDDSKNDFATFSEEETETLKSINDWEKRSFCVFQRDTRNGLLSVYTQSARSKARCNMNSFMSWVGGKKAFAESGFGCDPAKLGTKVFGQFLIDGDDAAFRRGSFFGIADESKLPGWAKERLQKLTAPKNDGPAQTGVTM